MCSVSLDTVVARPTCVGQILCRDGSVELDRWWCGYLSGKRDSRRQRGVRRCNQIGQNNQLNPCYILKGSTQFKIAYSFLLRPRIERLQQLLPKSFVPEKTSIHCPCALSPEQGGCSLSPGWFPPGQYGMKHTASRRNGCRMQDADGVALGPFMCGWCSSCCSDRLKPLHTPDRSFEVCSLHFRPGEEELECPQPFPTWSTAQIRHMISHHKHCLTCFWLFKVYVVWGCVSHTEIVNRNLFKDTRVFFTSCKFSILGFVWGLCFCF